jgi:hypothetical protein
MRRRRFTPYQPHTVWLLRFCIANTSAAYPIPCPPPVTSSGDTPRRGAEAPNSKIQAPEKVQTPSFKIQYSRCRGWSGPSGLAGERLGPGAHGPSALSGGTTLERVLNAVNAQLLQQVGFPEIHSIARLRRRVRRQSTKATKIGYLTSSLTLDELDAAGLIKLKRGDWTLESRLHHALDLTLGERNLVMLGQAHLQTL